MRMASDFFLDSKIEGSNGMLLESFRLDTFRFKKTGLLTVSTWTISFWSRKQRSRYFSCISWCCEVNRGIQSLRSCSNRNFATSPSRSTRNCTAFPSYVHSLPSVVEPSKRDKICSSMSQSRVQLAGNLFRAVRAASFLGQVEYIFQFGFVSVLMPFSCSSSNFLTTVS